MMMMMITQDDSELSCKQTNRRVGI